MKNANTVDYIVMSAGTIFGIANIEHILGIVLLVIQIAWFMTKLIYSSYKSIKENEDLSHLDDEVDEFTDTINSIKDKIAKDRAENEEKLKGETEQIGDE